MKSIGSIDLKILQIQKLKAAPIHVDRAYCQNRKSIYSLNERINQFIHHPENITGIFLYNFLRFF